MPSVINESGRQNRWRLQPKAGARAEAVAKMCGAQAVDDAAALFDDPTIDAIDVCVPTANHAELVVAALEHGKHVFCETPFALRSTEAETMLEAAKHSGRIFTVTPMKP